MVIDPTKLTNAKTLELGLYNGTVKGTGFASLTFTVTMNGTQLLKQSFTTAAAAMTYFTNDAINLGALTATTPFTLQISMIENLNQANSGFYTNILVGNATTTAASARAPMAVASNTAAMPSTTENHHEAFAAALFDAVIGHTGTAALARSAPHGMDAAQLFASGDDWAPSIHSTHHL